MKILKLKAYQSFASYRIPKQYIVRPTYPLPPLSTVKGLFHSTLDAKEFIPVSMSIQGKSLGIVENLQSLQKFSMKNEGTTTPCFVSNVYDIDLVIYLSSEEEYLEKFKEKIWTKGYPSLGRREDILRVDSVDFVDLNTVKFSSNNDYELNYDIYMNENKAHEAGLKGINYRMAYKYNADKNIRYFNGEDGRYPVTYLNDSYINKGTFLYDSSEDRIVDLVGAYHSDLALV